MLLLHRAQHQLTECVEHGMESRQCTESLCVYQRDFNLVVGTGHMHSRPWGEDRIYEYVHPLASTIVLTQRPLGAARET